MHTSHRMLVMTAALALVVGCGDGNDNHDGGGGATPTPIATPASTATALPQIPCPELITYTVQQTGSDLDVGWTGIFHDQLLGTGGSLSFDLDCVGSFLGQCGDCALTGPIASTTIVDNHRCQNDTSVKCTSDADCSSGSCAFFFGAPLPLSGGGVAICVTNRVSGPVTGTVRPELGEGTSDIGIIFTSFIGIDGDQPCPVCSGAAIGTAGTCNGGPRNGQACTTDGTTLAFGNTSFDCPPDTSADIGASTLPLNLTTGTRELAVGPTCTGTGFVGAPCYCQGQLQPNQCDDGVCTVDAANEGTCEAGPVDSLCAIESFRTCESNEECPATGDTCISKSRNCLGSTDASGALNGSITRTGAPSQATPLQVAAFCIDATRSGAVNAAAGLPGPGALRLPTTACIKPSCP